MAGQAAGEVASDHVGRKRGDIAGLGLIEVVRQAQHLDRPGPVGQAADELALLEAGDQAVDAGFGLQAQRLLHFIEGGRDPVTVQVIVDEEQQLMLFFGQHRPSRPVARSATKSRTKQKRRHMF